MGHLLHGPGHGPLARRRRPSLAGDGEGDGGQHGCAPRAEVLGREVPARDLFDVVVDVGRLHVHPAPALAGGEQLGTAAPAALEGPHDGVHLGVDDGLDPALAALAHVIEGDDVVLDPHVVLANGRQAEALVLLGVALAADAEEAEVQQAHGTGQHPPAVISTQQPSLVTRG